MSPFVLYPINLIAISFIHLIPTGLMSNLNCWKTMVWSRVECAFRSLHSVSPQ